MSRPAISRCIPHTCLPPSRGSCLSLNFFFPLFSILKAVLISTFHQKEPFLLLCVIAANQAQSKARLCPMTFWPDYQIVIHRGLFALPPPLAVSCLKVCRWSCRVNRTDPKMSGSILGECSYAGCLLKSLICQGGTQKLFVHFHCMCVCGCTRAEDFFFSLLKTFRCYKQEPFALSPCGSPRFKALKQVRWRLKVG